MPMFKSLIYSISAWIIPSIILITLVFAVVKKIPVYETFIDGAKDGLKVTVGIIPYLIAIITAVSMLRASGAIDLAARAFSGCLDYFKIPVDVVPIMFIRSLSGSAVLGLFSEIAGNFGPDAYATKLAAIMVGSSETTFYVLSVYFGAVGVKKFRHSLCAGVFADIIGIIAAVLVARWLFL
ncbi:MAG TPA: spore maturation protein [Candidatus Limenecus avicola]|uniref:Spore maturation protein n=1 Tax=Candidatus Limenecus avicola TaxID=2840847 RepID=A0A9D1N0Y9_9CLOT|nr:MAG TPA: spore maturation protein [Candidatus Gastranaerophilales bacterium HUM_21]HIU93104.1 spore maturation protein [Candidatus Limenecus avicola]